MKELVFLLMVLISTPSWAATYYVRIDGSDLDCDGTRNEAGGAGTCAWRTMDHAADSVSSGDVVRVQPGTYEERVTPGVDGSSVSDTVTFVADGSVTVCGFDFTENHHIRVIGFIVDTDEGSCSMNNSCVNIFGTNTHLEFWHNTFRDANYNGIRGTGVGSTNMLTNSLMIGNSFSRFGIGNGSGIAVNTPMDHCLIAYNEVHDSHPDVFYMFATNSRWLNNYSHDLSEASGGHSDVFQTGSNDLGWANNLIEAHFQVGTGNEGDEHTAQISHSQSENCTGGCGDMTENVFRRNVWHNVSNGTVGINQTDDGPVTFTRYYHNTTAEACENSPNTRYGVTWYGTGTSDSYLFNNIEFESWGNGATSGLEVFYVTGSLTADYNLAFDPDGSVTFSPVWSDQAHEQSNADPDFNDYANDDFTIGSSSQAIGNAGPLTVTVGSGTGTAFNVAPHGGGFFRGDDTSLGQYGGNLVVGDLITVGTDTVRIESISGDAITVTESFTWEDGEGVFFGDAAVPDIGAYPYKPGGYDLTATFVSDGGTVTVTPSDASLVRMVVVFEDGIPVGVDSISPFSVSGVGDGSLDVRVYLLYASKTLWIAATPSDAVCGDSTAEGIEVCDGTDVKGQTCLTLGCTGGDLGCLGDCSGFDVSNCNGCSPICGDGMVDEGEECDGANMASQTCQSLGCAGGTLACSECEFDLSGCNECAPVCGASDGICPEGCDHSADPDCPAAGSDEKCGCRAGSNGACGLLLLLLAMGMGLVFHRRRRRR